MVKKCVICGRQFAAPPSSKKVTCSRDCSTIRKVESHTGTSNTWSDESRKRLSAARKSEGYTPSLARAFVAAMARPDSQRGPQNRNAKRWVLIDPSGRRHEFTNLLDWARRHAELFDTVESDADRERVARNIRSGFGGIVLSMSGRRKTPCSTYKGWRLGDWPRDK